MTDLDENLSLTDETVTTPSGVVLHRIRAVRDLPEHGVKCGYPDRVARMWWEEKHTHGGVD